MTDFREHVSAEAATNIERWLSESKYSEYKAELETMIAEERWQELEDAFFKVIEFGTAGRRGVTGIGSNRINRVTIGESAQALCEYARRADASAPEKGVVIACDTRLSSPELSKYAASVCAGNGFKTYIFEDFRATPELSFAVRELGAAVGIVISASHNPPADNGFKAYWSDGAQLAAPHDTGVLSVAEEITDIRLVNFDEAVQDGRIIRIGKDIDEAYISAVLAQAEGTVREVKIVYSPLHGAGQTNTLPVLQQAGFHDIVLVEEQMTPDGNFPTVENGKPNPQEKAANKQAVELLHEAQADIAITNDPDADRLGVMVRQNDETIYLTGNQSYILAADYSLSKLQEKGQLTPNHYLVNTFVTTDMGKALATHYGMKCYANLPVGFKYIGALIREKEPTDEVFVFGGEESYGGLKGDYARDKDGASAALPMAEYAAELKQQGKTLYDRLLELYATYGIYVERMDNIDCPGADGFVEMRGMMQQLRESPPLQIGEQTVTAVLDYKSLERRDLQTGIVTPIDSIANDTVALEIGDQRRRLIVRPSGTEPKMKIYGMWYEPAESSNTTAIAEQYATVDARVAELARQLEVNLRAA